MEQFELRDKIIINKDLFGNIAVVNVALTTDVLDKAIIEIVLNYENLKYVFSTKAPLLTKDNKIQLLNRFLPPNEPVDIDSFVSSELRRNHNFYSFAAEAILAIVMRDVFNYHLSACVLKPTDTIYDSHTGVDGCFYDKENNLIILGEAKFYTSVLNAINNIRNGFVDSDAMANKLDSLLRAACSNKSSKKIVLQETNASKLSLLTFDDFLKMDLKFTGFIIHEDLRDLSAENFKNHCSFTSKDIEDKVQSLFPSIGGCNYSLVMLHLPVESKERLIASFIKEALHRKSEI